MKRAFDVLISVLAMMLLGPVFVAIALAIHLSDRGPIFFRQRRVGLNGKEFQIYKFRSMVLDAERLGGYSTADGDARITPIGRLIRRTSIDELPQLLNVIKGDMSLVGPRPDVPAQRELYSAQEWTLRHRVRPGITGLAQATLRSAATLDERKRLDLEYAANPGLVRDFLIILMTFRQVFGKGGN